MRKLRVLDLFCGAGGAAVGYHRAFTAAGFAVDITGVDCVPQKHYPYHFELGDAMTWPLDGYDFVHASPPCQDHSVLKALHKRDHKTGWMLAATYERLAHQSASWIIENVQSAPMRHPVMLCGTMFNLRVLRHRLFDSSHLLYPPGSCHHVGSVRTGEYVTVAGHGYNMRGPRYTVKTWHEAMGINWMSRDELAQAIPPAYTEYLGAQIARVLAESEAA